MGNRVWFDVSLLVEHGYPDYSEEEVEQHEVNIEDSNDHALELHEKTVIMGDKRMRLLETVCKVLSSRIEHLKDALTALC